jgi:hypothetical protein
VKCVSSWLCLSRNYTQYLEKTLALFFLQTVAQGPNLLVNPLFSFHGARACSGKGTPHYQSFRSHSLTYPPTHTHTHTHTHTRTHTNSIGLLWMSDQPDAETSIWQHLPLTRDKHPRPQGEFEPTLPGNERLWTDPLDIPIFHQYTSLPYCLQLQADKAIAKGLHTLYVKLCSLTV